MSKPISDWKENIITGSDVVEYLDKRIVIGFCESNVYNDDYQAQLTNIGVTLASRIFARGCGFYFSFQKQSSVTDTYGDCTFIMRKTYMHGSRPTNSRIIGVVLGTNDDKSLKIKLLGNNISLNLDNFKYDAVEMNTFARVGAKTGNTRMGDFPALITWQPSAGNLREWAGLYCNGIFKNNSFDVDCTFNDEHSHSYSINNFIGHHCKQGTVDILRNKILNLTDDDSTVTMGIGYPTRYQNLMETPDINCGLIDNAINGDIFDILQIAYGLTTSTFSNYKIEDFEVGTHTIYVTPSLVVKDYTYAMFYKLFNIPLTYSHADALKYIHTGELPSDVFLFPFDLNNLPTTDGIPPTSGTDNPPSGENGDSGIVGIPTEDAEPAVTTNMLNNNNMYWLQAGQLESFITWFWQHAGEIIDVEDLWQKITGLYTNLAEAIINIRYFPVDPQYIGGVSDTQNIIISSIEMPITGIKKLNKQKYIKRILGNIQIPAKYNAFTDFSPYTSIMLYLPFHGWVDLDIDIFCGNRLEVRCIYDYISGTIQYGIYVISNENEFLVNTCVAKMAVDIPITLQSKNDRDSAIFSNVTNGFGNLLGAGASVATGNPIGLVMSTGGLATGGANSAPIKTNGTVGETGAFYLPNKCAYYIKRPSYNRPKDYGSRVGFPSNQGGKLSNFSGLTVVYNPQITFNGNKNADNVTMKPLQSEIDEIYQLLEKGVII